VAGTKSKSFSGAREENKRGQRCRRDAGGLSGEHVDGLGKDPTRDARRVCGLFRDGDAGERGTSGKDGKSRRDWGTAKESAGETDGTR